MHERLDKPKVESALKEAHDFIESEPTEIDLIQQQLLKLRQEEQSLRESLFGNKLIDFEPIEKFNKDITLGTIEFNQVKITPIEQKIQTNDYKLVLFDPEKLDSVFSLYSEIFPLQRGNFCLMSSNINKAHMAVASSDFATIECLKFFASIHDGKFSYQAKSIQVTSCGDDGRIVVRWEFETSHVVHVLSEDLSLLARDVLICTHSAVNKNYIDNLNAPFYCLFYRFTADLYTCRTYLSLVVCVFSKFILFQLRDCFFSLQKVSQL
jgi:hypothetical protein